MVTTARLTHATPASLYAHSVDRDWESDADVAAFGFPAGAAARPDAGGCNRDIAAQLVYSDIGREVKVVFGGGRKNFLRREGSTEENPGKREDEDLTEAYQRIKEEEGKTYR